MTAAADLIASTYHEASAAGGWLELDAKQLVGQLASRYPAVEVLPSLEEARTTLAGHDQADVRLFLATVRAELIRRRPHERPATRS